jgi:Fibronectin type III-like domain/Glycosyl hydrolase family 3 N terminal domain
LPAIPAIGLEAIVTSDGPTGVKCAGQTPVRRPVVPCGTALAATWSPDLVEEVASLLGEAARTNGVHVLLAPATNMLRTPLAGRNFEYYGEDPLLDCGDVEVAVRVRNRGLRPGKEVVQVYVGSEDPGRPRRELKAFGRIDLDAGAEGELKFTLSERAFSRWDTEAGRLALIPGRHEIAVGSSSPDLRLRDSVTFADEPAALASGER